MNQECIKINVKVDKIDEIDYMVFELDGNMNVNLNDECGQNDLKKVFSILLNKLIKNDIELIYLENEDYNVNLYKDVCREYVKDLNKEIINVKKLIPSELIMLNNIED